MSKFFFRIRQILLISALCISAYLIFDALSPTIDKIQINRQEINSLLSEKSLNSYEDHPIKVYVTHSDRNRDKENDVSIATKLKQQTCKIPKLDINGEEVIKYFKKHIPLECLGEPNWVYVDSDGVLRITEKRKKANCKIQYFWRVDDNTNDYGEKIEIHDGFVMNGSDYATVSCIQGFEKWNSILWSLNDNVVAHNKAREMKKKTKHLEKDTYNIYFLGFDSLSQMSFRRKLPKTVKVIEDVIGSVILDGYNIVGDGTPQAFIPILTAQTETELPLTRKRYKNANYVDNVYPFIWKNYSDAGYVTMYGEDAFNIGTFTYRLKGFQKSPTDHYTRTFFEQVEKLSNRNCIGTIPLHKMWFENARKFMKTYSDVPRFLLMHQSLLSHDDINLVDVEDDDVAAHLTQMNDEGFFDDSIVIVMADHGHRFAKLRATHQGQLEERLPFFSIGLPKKLRGTERGKTMYKNLLANKDRLTTPFDIHETLMDILNLPHDTSDFNEMPDMTKHRSLSLFRPIPDTRGCGEAGIEPHWCTCLQWVDAMNTVEKMWQTRRILRAVLREINIELATEKDLCAPLSLVKLIDAKKLQPHSNLLAYKNVKDPDGFVPDLSNSVTPNFGYYQLKFQTSPGVAIYEVTLFFNDLEDSMKLDFNSISHVNKYGDAPHCIIDKNYYLATFCVCYDKI